MSMFNDISWGSQDNKQDCELSANLVSSCARRFSPGRWSFFGPGSEKKWCSTHESKPQGEWDRVAERMMIKFVESRHPVFRSTSPLSRGVLQSKGGGQLSIHFCADEKTVETVFRTQPAQYLRSRLRFVWRIQCLYVPASSLMKTPTPLTDDPAQEDLLQKYQERVERLSQQNRVIKFCNDAGFLTTVDVGQYFMTKDTEEFSQFTESVACREYTLPGDEKSSDPKGWIRGKTKIGPVLQITTSYLQGKYGVEIRIESVNKDNSHSCVRISHGLNKLVTHLSNNKENDNDEQGTSEMQFENFALKTNALAFASRSKAKAKPKDVLLPANPEELTHRGKKVDWCWARRLFSSRLPSVKTLSTLLCRGHLSLQDDGAIEFWRIKEYLRFILINLNIGLMKKTEEHHGKRRRKQEKIQYCTDSSGEILYLRALQGHSGRNLIDPSLQECINSERFHRVHLSHRMCNQLTPHHEFRIDTGRSKFEQKTDSILSACGSYEQRTQRSGQNRPGRTTSCMVQAENVEETSKTLCVGSTSNLLKRKDLSSIKHDRTPSSFTTHSQLTVSRRLSWWKLEESYKRK